jgi:hypothetical protein
MRRIVTVVLGLALMALPAAAFARGGGHGGGFHGGGFHGGGFHGGGFHGGGFHGAPAAGFHGGFRGAPGAGWHGGFRGAPAIGGIHGRWVGNRFWHPGYWGWRGGARLWIGPGWGVGFYPGCAWVQPGWVWDGYQWVWQEGYCSY